MQVHEFVDEGLGHSSYVIDLGDGTAAVVDPPRFPTEHGALIDRAGLDLRWAIDTHSHADYVSGSPGLAARRGITFIAPAASNLETPHQAIRDGEQIALATDVTLTAIATPGHTPDHHAYALEVDGVPVALFTGGSLMVGTVGRTDLCGPELAVGLLPSMADRRRENPSARAGTPFRRTLRPVSVSAAVRCDGHRSPRDTCPEPARRS